MPHERFAAAEEEYTNAHIVELLHFASYLCVRVDDRRYIVHGAMLAVQVASVRDDDCAENGQFFAEKYSFYAECGKMHKGGKLHGAYLFSLYFMYIF
jgi:hypothetical protein